MTLYPIGPDPSLSRIEPAPNYPAVDSGERPVVVQVTLDAVATARRRVDELRADVDGNLVHYQRCDANYKRAGDELQAAQDTNDRAGRLVTEARDDVDTATRLLEAAKQHLTQLDAITAPPWPQPGDARVLTRFDAEHEAALAEQAGRLRHAHDTDLETVDRGHRAELDELRAKVTARDYDRRKLRAKLDDVVAALRDGNDLLVARVADLNTSRATIDYLRAELLGTTPAAQAEQPAAEEA